MKLLAFVVIVLLISIVIAFDEDKKLNDQIDEVIDVEDNEKTYTDDAINEILELQRIEEEERLKYEQDTLSDHSVAIEAERLAKEQELKEKEKEAEAIRLNEQNKTKSNEDDWIKRTRPGRVSKSAVDTTIKKAYRNKALIIHPDKNPHPDASIAFDAIQEALETLSSPIKR
eukprot:gene22848-29590_t